MTMPRPKFDATINLGHIFTMVTFVMGGALAYANVQVSISELSIKIDHAGETREDFKQEMRDIKMRIRELEMPRR